MASGQSSRRKRYTDYFDKALPLFNLTLCVVISLSLISMISYYFKIYSFIQSVKNTSISVYLIYLIKYFIFFPI